MMEPQAFFRNFCHGARVKEAGQGVRTTVRQAPCPRQEWQQHKDPLRCRQRFSRRIKLF